MTEPHDQADDQGERLGSEHAFLGFPPALFEFPVTPATSKGGEQ